MTSISISCPHCGAALRVRDASRLGQQVKCPKCAKAFVPKAPAAVAVSFRDAESPREDTVPIAEGSPLPRWPSEELPRGATERLRMQRKRNRRRTIIAGCISALVLLAAGAVAVFVTQSAPKKLVISEANERTEERDASIGVDELTDEESARDVHPIELQYIPAGSRLVIHVRPKEFWQPNSRGEEFRFCLGPIAEFLAARIQELCRRDPSDLTEALFCLIPNEPGTPPDLAAVFRLEQEVRKSELLDQFGGRRVEGRGGMPYYLGEKERAYFFPDGKTIVVCPAKPVLIEEVSSAVNDLNPTSPGLEELLLLTDRTRPVTLLVEPVSLRVDAEFLVPSLALPWLNVVLDYLGSEVETVAWSLFWREETFHSEILFRPQGGSETRAVERELRHRLDELPADVLRVVRQMSPVELGKRKVIGRFPAMVKAFVLASRTKIGPRTVKLETRLPERAAPNLALGALLTWDESTRTVVKSGPPTGEDKPDLTPLSEKLRRRISVDFRREPLQGAFAYIASEIKARLEIDGDALKLSAYTKNMPQTFAMENAPAIDVIERILKQPMYEKMCLVVDETKNSLLITTYPVAEQQGLKPYEFTP